MPPKQHTPYQINKGLEYIRKVPPFLQAMMEKEQIRPPELEKFRIDDEEDYDEQDEIEGAQIVVMKEGKHLSEEQVRQHLENKEDGVITKADNDEPLSGSEDEAAPAVDSDGKILFRKPKTKKKGETKKGKPKNTDAIPDLAQEVAAMKEKLNKKRKQDGDKEEGNTNEKTKKKKSEASGKDAVKKKEKKKNEKGGVLLSFDQED
ncbi:hypothetical protein BC937DRAFT_87326 [Endogone sp. FLAS-F59071]|nr:hypothetical protein BC937DRAFT_87326 [Endogone sp. FLAS-F59071]|eukprot:RUS19535.1 hypothetical protein BC937DRAFT_87326 [Endogone sp. FLAS-F59071]